MRAVVPFFLAIAFLTSCVSSKVHKDLQSRYDALDAEANDLRKANGDYAIQVKELIDKVARLQADLKRLAADTTKLGEDKRQLQEKYKKLNQQYEYVLENNSSLMAASAKENKELIVALSGFLSRRSEV